MPKPKAKPRSNDDILAAWNAPGAAGFHHWLADVKPRILTKGNAWEPVALEPWQDAFMVEALEPGDGKPFRYSIVLHVTPRRHSKSTLFALLALWLFTSRSNQTIQALGNSEIHCEKVQMRTLRGIIRNTPALKAMIGEENLRKQAIEYPGMGNIIQASTVTMSGAFGDKLNLLWVSDFHACPDTGPFDAYQASLLDSEGTLCLIDSNTDHEGGHVHGLEMLAETDPGILCRRIEYPDLETYLREAPAWIDREKVVRLQKTQLPTAFSRDILGKRSSARNALFPAEVITLCRAEIPCPFPPDRLEELTGGRKYVIGGGLDRSKKLFGGDNTVWTTTLKVASAKDAEPEYFVLNQDVVVPNHARCIKKAILEDHRRYNLDAVTLEQYEVADLKPWLDDQDIPAEVLSATSTNQNLSFVELHRIAKEGRLHFSQGLEMLASEMQTFVYEEKRDGNYTFGHASQKFHDDTVYSLNWSVFATRAAVLSVYALKRIECRNLRPTRSLCFLMGGDMELLCKHECPAYHEVAEMFRGYMRLRLDDDHTLPGFYAAYVKLDGPRIYQGV
jgi:hypothetical protein